LVREFAKKISENNGFIKKIEERAEIVTKACYRFPIQSQPGRSRKKKKRLPESRREASPKSKVPQKGKAWRCRADISNGGDCQVRGEKREIEIAAELKTQRVGRGKRKGVLWGGRTSGGVVNLSGKDLQGGIQRGLGMSRGVRTPLKKMKGVRRDGAGEHKINWKKVTRWGVRKKKIITLIGEGNLKLSYVY